MRYKLTLLSEAESELADAVRWYEEKSKGVGSEFLRVVEAGLSRIQRYPLAFPVVYKQVRRLVLRRFPYSLFYVVDKETIVVVSCFHAKRKPSLWQKRS